MKLSWKRKKKFKKNGIMEKDMVKRVGQAE